MGFAGEGDGDLYGDSFPDGFQGGLEDLSVLKAEVTEEENKDENSTELSKSAVSRRMRCRSRSFSLFEVLITSDFRS